MKPICATSVDEMGFMKRGSYCLPDCPIHPNAQMTTDDTLRVAHHYDPNDQMIALKLFGLTASSLLLIGLVFIGLGTIK